MLRKDTPNMKETIENHVEETYLKKIAKEEFRIESWETRMSDSLDFYDVSISSIRDALWKAFEAGRSYQFDLRR
jgi:hypothetical protein